MDHLRDGRPGHPDESEQKKRDREFQQVVKENRAKNPNGTLGNAIGGLETKEDFAAKVKSGEIDINTLTEATKQEVRAIWEKQEKK